MAKQPTKKPISKQYKSNLVSHMATMASATNGIERLADSIERYGSLGTNKPWSWADHEMQIAIANDVSRRIAVRKCSQVGLSELNVQKCLAIAAQSPDSRIIFSLPNKKMSQQFSKDRFDSAIRNSPYYSRLVRKANNSAMQKLIGTTYLYVVGTFGESEAISIPANFVINDEVDFSNQEVLGLMDSRLRHQEQDEHGDGGYRFMFSTPTVEDFGIDIHYHSGDKKHYAVKCKGCGHEQVPEYETQMVLPGFDRPIGEFSSIDLASDRYDLDQAKLVCRHCGQCLYQNGSLFDPTRRRWIAEAPGKHISSYQICPWDVPKFNKPKAILRQVQQYKSEESFFNFVLGLPRTTADNSFVVNEIFRKEQRSPIEYPMATTNLPNDMSLVIGMDVGKTCHLVVGTPTEVDGRRRIAVIWAVAFTSSDTKSTVDQAKEIFDYYQPKHMCVDAGPDITLVEELVKHGRGRIQAVEYARSVEGLNMYTEKDKDQSGDFYRVLRADRNKVMGKLMAEHNKGQIYYPASTSKDIFKHLKAVKRITNAKANDANEIVRYTNNGDDHFAHAMAYMRVAYEVVELENFVDPTFHMPPAVAGVRMRSTSDDDMTGGSQSLRGTDGFFNQR